MLITILFVPGETKQVGPQEYPNAVVGNAFITL